MVLGDLEARGSVEVRAEGGLAPVRLSDTSYAYVSAEWIQTRDGVAALRMDGGDRLALGAQSKARVEGSAGRYAVEVSRGSLAYSVSPQSELTINAAGSILRPSGGSINLVSTGGEARISGWISVDESGKLNVSARSGDVEVSRGGAVLVVRTGSSASISAEGGQLVAIQVEGATEVDGALDDTAPSLSAGEAVAFLGTAGVVSVAGSEALDGDDDGELASP